MILMRLQEDFPVYEQQLLLLGQLVGLMTVYGLVGAAVFKENLKPNRSRSLGIFFLPAVKRAIYLLR